WQGGLAWLKLDGDAEAEAVRRLVAAHGGGHATLVRAAPAVRAAVAVFQPQPPALAALSARLKAEFDPRGILNPRRLGEDNRDFEGGSDEFERCGELGPGNCFRRGCVQGHAGAG